MYERILVPTDGSDVAEAAVDHALDLAERDGATVHALYVVDVDAVEVGLGTEQVDRLRAGRLGEMDELRERAEAATGRIAEAGAARGVEVIEHTAVGVPHRIVADYADDHGADLVVMGSHGRSGVRRALLGSITERVLRTTRRPVLVVDARADSVDSGERSD
ncbi:universal stress protein [Halobacteriales archaeon QS_5_70_17]|jgi:nucleotide-binding universal stress UspA family protein|nr:MAG: universal stress protein [Halobacteriales archaeon QS_5_70_17]